MIIPSFQLFIVSPWRSELATLLLCRCLSKRATNPSLHLSCFGFLGERRNINLSTAACAIISRNNGRSGENYQTKHTPRVLPHGNPYFSRVVAHQRGHTVRVCAFFRGELRVRVIACVLSASRLSSGLLAGWLASCCCFCCLLIPPPAIITTTTTIEIVRVLCVL